MTGLTALDPMSAEQRRSYVLLSCIDPAIAMLQPYGIPASLRARALLLAISGQEAGWHYRAQIGGPARGLWQFECGGGVVGVLQHWATKGPARAVCFARSVDPKVPQAVHAALEHDDVLAACFARLLLYTDPRPLPEARLDASGMAYDYYVRNWRPGKQNPPTWLPKWQASLETLAALEPAVVP